MSSQAKNSSPTSQASRYSSRGMSGTLSLENISPIETDRIRYSRYHLSLLANIIELWRQPIQLPIKQLFCVPTFQRLQRPTRNEAFHARPGPRKRVLFCGTPRWSRHDCWRIRISSCFSTPPHGTSTLSRSSSETQEVCKVDWNRI